MTKQAEFNHIKRIIENDNNKECHLVGIGNIVRNFQYKYGICSLSNSLNKMKNKLVEKF